MASIPTAPPIMPPIWGVVNPELGVPLAAVLEMGVADSVTLATIPALMVVVAVGALGTVEDVMVVV